MPDEKIVDIEHRPRFWADGSTLLAAVLERFAPGATVTITRDEVEALAFGTSLPCVFELIGDDTITITVRRPSRE